MSEPITHLDELRDLLGRFEKAVAGVPVPRPDGPDYEKIRKRDEAIVAAMVKAVTPKLKELSGWRSFAGKHMRALHKHAAEQLTCKDAPKTPGCPFCDKGDTPVYIWGNPCHPQGRDGVVREQHYCDRYIGENPSAGSVAMKEEGFLSPARRIYG